MRPKGKSQVLSSIPLFSSLTETELEALASAPEKRFDAGAMLFWEGEPCAGIFLIAGGSAKIFKTAASGREMMLALEHAPSTAAELPLFDGGAYPASVRAEERTVCYFINKADFQGVCREFRQRHPKARAPAAGRQPAAGVSEFPLPLTRQEVASRVRPTRGSVPALAVN